MEQHQSRPVPKGVPLAVLLQQFLSALLSFWPGNDAKRLPAATTCSLTIEAEILNAMLGDPRAAKVKRLSNVRKGVLQREAHVRVRFYVSSMLRESLSWLDYDGRVRH